MIAEVSRARRLVVILLLTATLVLSACGGAQPAPAPATEPPAPAATLPPAPTASAAATQAPAAEAPKATEAPAAATVAAPAAAAPAAGLPDGKGKRVAVIWGSQGNEYNVLNHDSAVAALKEMGVEVLDFNAGGDRNRQVSMIENAIQMKVDGMLMGDIAPEIIDPVILKAQDAGIPTVSAHGGSNAVVNDVTSDNFEAGPVGARMVQKWIGDRPPNVITAYEPGYGPIDQLFAAYQAAVPFTVPEYKEIGRVNAHWPNTLPEAKAQMEALLQQNKPEDIGLVFGTYDLEAIGMAQAIEEKGLDIPVIGYNLTKDILEMVKRGSPIVATAGGDPREEGTLAAINLVKHLNGEQLPKITFIPIKVVDRDNIDEYMAQNQ